MITRPVCDAQTGLGLYFRIRSLDIYCSNEYLVDICALRWPCQLTWCGVNSKDATACMYGCPSL